MFVPVISGFVHPDVKRTFAESSFAGSPKSGAYLLGGEPNRFRYPASVIPVCARKNPAMRATDENPVAAAIRGKLMSACVRRCLMRSVRTREIS